MGMNPTCSCACSFGSKTKQIKYLEDQKIVQFLMGLNDSYTIIRGTILMQNPLPKLSTVYNNLVQEERQREIHNVTQFQMDSASFYARNSRNKLNYSGNPYYTQKQSVVLPDSKRPLATNLECRYCKRQGHTIEKCFRLQNRNMKFAGSAQFSDNALGVSDTVPSSSVQHTGTDVGQGILNTGQFNDNACLE
ncbi:hypothetical protein RND81_06G159800 [Saponaria officinalis]|uniref:Uncharacterized protein n=1 Tax=Saponaria officinalis TaxID=3572 RepID=A0AAW1KBX2_SAPOF